MDQKTYKRLSGKHVGIGGIKCPCCALKDKHREKTLASRYVRHTLKDKLMEEYKQDV